MSFKTILEEAEKRARDAMKVNPKKIGVSFELPETSGVYLIYKNSTVIYIGQSDNLKDRFKKHLSASKSIKGSAFRRILVGTFVKEPQSTKEWIKENCSISFIEIKDTDMCKLVVSLLIAYFRPVSKDLLNSPRKKILENKGA